MPPQSSDPTPYDAATYGDRWASIYDDRVDNLDPTAAIERLVSLTRDGRALELGIGTGRVALPLAARGIEVHGVDASEAMVAHLREKPGGAHIPITIGDFADVPVDGYFDLVFVAANTFFALLTQEDQVRCFQNVANHLTEEGSFVIEAFVPDPARWERGQHVSANRADERGVSLDVSTHDPVLQRTDRTARRDR